MKKISEQLKLYPLWRPKKNPANGYQVLNTHTWREETCGTALQMSAGNTCGPASPG